MDELLDSLAREGRQVSRGTFTLDWRKAREKLQRFQLLDPHRWVLHAVAAAVAGGASEVRVRTDADDCEVSFDGPAFPADQLEQLFACLLSEQHDDRLRELALAVNAAAALKPSRLIFRTGTVAMELAGTDLRLTSIPAVERNELAVRERVSWKVLRQLVSGRTPEAEILTQSAWQAPIKLNGASLAHPWDPKAPVTVQSGAVAMVPGPYHTTANLHECRGAALALSGGTKRDGILRILRYGVEICQRQADLGGWSVEAMVDAPQLRLNVSQSDVLEDESYRSLLIWLRSLVRLALIDLTRRDLTEDAAELLRLMASHKLTPGPPAPGLGQALAGAPLWRDHAGRPVSLLGALENYAASGMLRVTGARWEHAPLQGQVVLQSEPLLGKIFPRIEEGDSLLREAAAAHARRTAWEQGAPGPVRLGQTCYLLRVALPQGEIGFHGDPAEKARLFAYKGGRALVSTTVEELPGGLDLALECDLTPDEHWLHPVRDGAWEALLASLEEPLENAFTALCRLDPARIRAHVLGFMLHRVGRGDTRTLSNEMEALPMFTRLDERRMTLAQLRGRDVGYLAEPPPAEMRAELAEVLLLTTDEWTVLAHYLGEERLQDASALLAPRLRECEFLARPVLNRKRVRDGLVSLDLPNGWLLLERRPVFGTRFEVEALFQGRLLERVVLDAPPFGCVAGRIEVEGMAVPSPRYDRVGKGRADLVRWLQAQLIALAVRWASVEPRAAGLLDYFCGLTERPAEVEALPLLTEGVSLEELRARVEAGDPPELSQGEKLVVSRLVGREALERVAAEPVLAAGELPAMEYEAVYELPAGRVGLTRGRSSRIRVPGRKEAVKRCPVSFQAALREAPEGTDWHRGLLETVEELALERASQSVDYLIYLSERGLGERLAGVPVHGDVLGREYTLGQIVDGPVEYLGAGQPAPGEHPAGPLFRLTPEEVKRWAELFVLVEYRPPLTTLDDFFPGREWLVRVRLEEGELGVPREGEAGELRLLGPAGWVSRPLPEHRGLLGVVRGDGANLPFEQVERELAACPQDEAWLRRVRGWRDWRTLGLGRAESPLAVFQEGTAEPHEVEEAPMSDYQRLSEALREQMLRVLGDDPELRKAVPDRGFDFKDLQKGALCECTPDGRVFLNPKHRLVQHLVETPSPEEEYFYFLMSAVFSVINRARLDIKDEHEREFHARLLAHLLKEDG